MDETIRFIGIDFGTSTTVVSYMDYIEKEGNLVPEYNLNRIGYSGGPALIPTIIKVGGVQEPELYGNQVSDYLLEYYPNLIEKEFKMNLGSSVAKDKRDKAIGLTYKFFNYLYQGYLEYEKTQNSSIKERRVYVSYPAKWESEQKSITIDAAYEAFKNYPEVTINGIYSIDEPTAALHYSIISRDINEKAKEELRIDKNSFILIIDMGAGTTDLVLYEYLPNKLIKVLAKYPEPGKSSTTFGGREVDEIFKNHFKERFSEKLVDINELSFLNECKRWKEGISNFFNSSEGKMDFAYTPDLPQPLKSLLKGPVSKDYNRNKICWLLKDYLIKFPELVNSIIDIGKNNSEEFRKSNTDIDFVILTGGHSKWFFVEKMLKGKWVPGLHGNENFGSNINLRKIINENWRIIKTNQPQSIVSYGLCMSGIPIEVIQLSNCDVWLDIRLGDSTPEKELIVKRNIKLPYQSRFNKKFKCRIDIEDNKIPIIITPIIGVKGDDYLDSIKIELFTNIWRDFVTFFSEDRYRFEDVEVDLICKFDKNQIFSFEGKVTTPGIFGYEEKISLSPSEIAKKFLN